MDQIRTATRENDAQHPTAEGRPATAAETPVREGPVGDGLAGRTPSEAKRREPLWRQLLGGSLRARRTERGETLDEVADRAGVSPQYLSEIERGLKEPSSEIIAAVGSALDTSLLDLTLDVAQSLAAVAPAAGSAAQLSASQAAFALAA